MTFIRSNDSQTFGNTIKPLLTTTKLHVGVERGDGPRESVIFFLEQIRSVVTQMEQSPAEGKQDVLLSMLNVGCVMRDAAGNRLNVDTPLDMYWSSTDPANIYACVSWDDAVATAADKDAALAGVYPIDLALLSSGARHQQDGTAFVSDYS